MFPYRQHEWISVLLILMLVIVTIVSKGNFMYLCGSTGSSMNVQTERRKKNRHRRMPSINCIIELGAMRYMRHTDSPRHHSPERSIKLVGNWQTARLLIQKSIVYCTFNVLFLCPRYVPASTYLWPPNIRLHTYSSSIVRVFICLQFFFFCFFCYDIWWRMGLSTNAISILNWKPHGTSALAGSLTVMNQISMLGANIQWKRNGLILLSFRNTSGIHIFYIYETVIFEQDIVDATISLEKIDFMRHHHKSLSLFNIIFMSTGAVKWIFRDILWLYWI